MNNKAIKYRAIFYICIILTVVFLVAGLCSLHVVKKDAIYRSKNYVALYIYKYHALPRNFITKSEAEAMNANMKTFYNIGGDTFQNREGLIDNPNKLRLVECDIYTGNSNINSRGVERIVFFANGSLVYYTSDHYKTFKPITMWDINGASYVLFIVTGILILTQLVIATWLKRKSKVNAFAQWITALEVCVVIVLLIVFSPILAVLWIVDNIQQRQLGRSAEQDK